MSLSITIELPGDLEEKLRRESKDLQADVREAFALELFRKGRISHAELSRVLDRDRFATDGWLKRHNVFEGSPTREDIDADRETLNRVLNIE
jgi:predicted HTH domain antitoxin